MSLMISVVSHAAEPKTIDELKAHFENVSSGFKSMTADYTMNMDLAAASPQAAGMGDMTMDGTFNMLGKSMRMDMAINMAMGEQTMVINMDMVMNPSGMMYALMDKNGMIQAMKMDMNVVKEFAKEMGVPESVLNSSNMGLGMMQDPSKMLESYEDTYDLEIAGIDTLGDTQVYVLKATIKPEVLENIKNNSMLSQQAGMMESTQTLYIGAADGIMRKVIMGDFMTMSFFNINLNTKLSQEDMKLNIPEGVQVMDMTELIKANFSNK